MGGIKVRDANAIHKLIEDAVECEYVDFKQSNVYMKNQESLIKDIMAMANAAYEGKKYILLGIKDHQNGEREVIGLEDFDNKDSSNYQQLILNNVEPDIDLKYYTVDYQGKLIGVFEIDNNCERPYMMKKDYSKTLKKGYCLIRKGSQQSVASRSDLMQLISANNQVEIHFLESSMRTVELEEAHCASIRVSIRNLTDLPVTFIHGVLLVKDGHSSVLSKHPVYGLDEYIGADFTLGLSPKTERVGYLYLSFLSSDCLRLDMDEYGLTDKKLNFELLFVDTLDREYRAVLDDAHVYAFGKFLWKVQLKAKVTKERLKRR